MTESELQSAIIEYAELMGWRLYHVTNVHKKLRSHTSVGFPDLCMVRRGRLVFAELKNAKEKLSPDQEQWQIRLVQTTAEYHVWRPADWMGGVVDEVLR